MTCEDIRMYRSAYLDDELDAAESLRLERHVNQCRGCREVQEAQLALRSALRDPDMYFRPHADFEKRIASVVRLQAKKEAQKEIAGSERAWFDLFRMGSLRWVSASAVLLVIITAATLPILNKLRSPDEQLLANAVLTGHIRSLQAGHLIDVPSSDLHTVKPWFQGKLDFSPPVPDLSELGWILIGGRLDYLDGRPVAALIYQRRMHNINVFVWPRRGPAADTIQAEAAQGYQILHWNGADMTYWVVSDLNKDELMDFARAQRGH
jgi:anti-sigma factor RsiW